LVSAEFTHLHLPWHSNSTQDNSPRNNATGLMSIVVMKHRNYIYLQVITTTKKH